MSNIDKKQELILAQEKLFAARLGTQVLSKPPLHTWMILIPFLFLFFIQDLIKYKDGLKNFKDNYLLSRKKALLEAVSAIREDRSPDTSSLANQADLKGNAVALYANLLQVLAEHYVSLLRAEGESFQDLIQSAYGHKRSNFFLFIDQLTKTEKALNTVLLSQLSHDQEGVNSTIKKMETGSGMLHRADAELIFS